MKRDFLKSLGIEDNDVISKILDENSADIGRAKGELDTYKTKVTDLENDIKTKDSTIADLQKEADKVQGLNQQISQLQTDKNDLTTRLDTSVKEIKKDYAVEGKIRDFKGKNVKAIKALLDYDKITYDNDELGGVDEQLDALQKAEDSSMLFGETQAPPPAGTHYNNPPTGGGTAPTSSNFADAVAKALGK
jgi:chromosome segregation ATPase